MSLTGENIQAITNQIKNSFVVSSFIYTMTETDKEKLVGLWIASKNKLDLIEEQLIELEISFKAIHNMNDMDHTQVANDIQKIKKILES